MMKILDNMELCYGCGACSSICPTGAIDMKVNGEGFLEPVIDEGKCISCEKCKKTCPAADCRYSNSSEPDIFAFSAEEKILYHSSSGGIFTLLAEHVLQMGGYVVGAAYDSQFLVRHVMVDDISSLDRIRRSKYLQSDTGDTFRKTRELLDKGEYVLYSGCPCQIAGLLRFLEKDYDTLYTVDVLCHGVPSPGLFQEHLKNSFGGIEHIDDVEFRSREGWGSLFGVKQKNGDTRTFYGNRGVYMESFLKDVNLRASCYHCQYSKLPRQGNLTIGDLWAAGSLHLSFEYKKGVSVVLLNNEKGGALFQKALSKSKHRFYVQKLYGEGVEKPCNIKMLNENIFQPSTSFGRRKFHERQEFFENCSHMGFEKAVYASLHPFDVGIVPYLSNNYGSIATNYALYRAISDTGRKTAVMDNVISLRGEAAAFAKKYMNLCSSFMEKDDRQAANQCFETFVVGSDISWNWIYTEWSRLIQFKMLGFADENKRMISYAPSFGQEKGKKDIDENARAVCSYCLKRFDAISVREDYGVDMCRDLFDVAAEQVLDPVLLCDRAVWDELSGESQLQLEEDYLLAYILDPTPEKRKVILETAKNLAKKIVVILDMEGYSEARKRAMNLDDHLVKPGFIDWLAYFRHAAYVITDSFHGACFSILFGKKFAAIKNRSKGRFDSLARLISYPSLFFEDSRQLSGKKDIFVDIDYDFIYQNIELKRKESEEWLHRALNCKIKQKSSNNSTNLVLQVFQSMREKEDILRKNYAYQEEQRKARNEQLKSGKTWFDMICSVNKIVPGDSKLRKTDHLRDYFSLLKTDSKYVIVLSGRDECANHRGKFLEVSGLPLRKDVTWRNSYIAVIDGGIVKVDEKAKEELNINYEVVIGHPDYRVEYLDGKLNVCCTPLKCCKIKIKSQGFTEPSGISNSEIMIDNIDYSINKTGINMVVIDKETGTVLDSVNINTYSDPGLKINRV